MAFVKRGFIFAHIKGFFVMDDSSTPLPFEDEILVHTRDERRVKALVAKIHPNVLVRTVEFVKHYYEMEDSLFIDTADAVPDGDVSEDTESESDSEENK